MVFWMVVAARTARGAWHGNLFYAPCLQNLKEKVDDEDVSNSAGGGVYHA